MKEIIIGKTNSKQKVEHFVKKYLNEAPLSFIYKLFRKKDVKINGHWVKNDYILQENDVLRIYITDEQYNDFNKPKAIITLKHDLDIVYEDQNILILNKPVGVLVHESKDEKFHTLSNQVLSYLYSKGEFKEGDVFVPSPAHRLDRNTSGIILFGKNNEVLQTLMNLFKYKDQITKHYVALVYGAINKDGEINSSLIKDASKNEVYVSNSPFAKSALTRYHVLKNFKNYTLLDLEILTGRTHQIRVHMASIQHPVIGDAKYGNFAINKQFDDEFDVSSQLLHAKSITFGKIEGILSYLSDKTFEAPIPKNMVNVINHLQ